MTLQLDYQTAQENSSGENEIGTIWMDSTFSPIVRCRYKVENTRVGQLTNYDRLVLDICNRSCNG